MDYKSLFLARATLAQLSVFGYYLLESRFYKLSSKNMRFLSSSNLVFCDLQSKIINNEQEKVLG